jgi:hypothetical protein
MINNETANNKLRYHILPQLQINELGVSIITDSKPSKILKYIFLGSKSHAKSKNLLRELNITHILNCTPSKKYFVNYHITINLSI